MIPPPVARRRAVFTVLNLAIIAAAAAVAASCVNGRRAVSKEELATTLASTSSSESFFRWRKFVGIDFDVFHGLPKPPTSGWVGFYEGNHPSETIPPGSTARRGKLGTIPVTWHREIQADGMIHQSTVFSTFPGGYIHAWVNASSEGDLEKLTSELGALRHFQRRVSRTTPRYYYDPNRPPILNL